MSCDLKSTTAKYHQQIKQKQIFFVCLIALVIILSIWAISKGSYNLSLANIIESISNNDKAKGNAYLVIWNIRMPRIIAAIVSGWGLALAGLIIQSVIRNPLGSPSTLGISQGAAFGATFGIIIFNSSLFSLNLSDKLKFYSVTVFAFLGAIAATFVILLLAKIKKLSSEAIILSGVALSSLFVSGTFLIQYFANDTQVASALFWTFGDVARSNWYEIKIMSLVVFTVSIWVSFNSWNLNAFLSGEETAKGLGVSVETIRFYGMLMAAIMSAIITAFHGVIAFIGLIAPHIAKIIVGANHRFLIPFSCVIGAGLLLLADTIGRLLIGSGSLPVGIVTSFMGAPLFLYLLLKGK